MKSALYLFLLATLVAIPSPSQSADVFKYTPITHATFVLQAGATTIYVDPVGDAAAFSGFPPPDLILITHIHKDHLAPELIGALRREGTALIGPATVIEQLPAGAVMNNGDNLEIAGLKIEAIPAYNTTPERLNFHPQGRDNGYVLEKEGVRLYISGDTEDIPEMRALKNIDIAFVCMNLPFTMTVEQAASAVNAFKPKTVIPYHYRGKEGMSDLDTFAQLVSTAAVERLKWY
ncbi:MAG: MBL fold metallo-hydrolase [Desulfuromonas sp.]|nr:MAG: MBL fold metallo-hydrolase [Desulfuromonas sp.]